MSDPTDLDSEHGSAHLRPPTGRIDSAPGSLPGWTATAKIAFRYAFLFTVLYSLTFFGPTFVASLPWGTTISVPWLAATQASWMQLVRWLTGHALGSGITASGIPAALLNQLMSLLCISVLAGIGAAIWSLLDRTRRDYWLLHEWFRVYLRFTVGIVLLEYGVLKLLLNQFDYPPLPSTLMTPVGELDRMRMLAAFTSTSAVYQAFTGAVEVTAGLLLMVHRTATLGALLGMATMANVVVLNLAYFGGLVLIIAVSMFLMCAILLVPELSRLFAAVASSRAIPATAPRPLFATRTARRIAGVVGAVVILSTLASVLRSNLTDGMHSRGRPPLYGAYEVERIASLRGPAEAPDDIVAGWLAVMIDSKPSFNRMPGNAFGTIRTASGPRFVALDIDSIGKTLAFDALGPQRSRSQWAYSVTDSARLLLTGLPGTDSDSLVVVLRRRAQETFPLLAREAWRPDFWFTR